MLAGLLYEEALSFFRHRDHSSGLFPDDVLETLDDLGIVCRPVSKLPKRQPALVAVGWRNNDFGGHYVVWDPERSQFLDPLYGLIDRRDLTSFCTVEHIWATAKRNMTGLVKARKAKVVAEEVLKPFGPTIVHLSKTVEGFAIEARFATEPPDGAKEIGSVNGFPVRVYIAPTQEEK